MSKNNPIVTISVVIPIYNEEEIIEKLFVRCIKSLKDITEDFEVICIDDGSSDKSLEKLENCHQLDKRFKVLTLSRNFGHQSALLAGLSETSGEYIAMIDGDLQDPPELIKTFYEKALEGYDVVYAVRKKRKEGIFKKFAYWLYYRLLRSVSNVDIPLDSGDFSLISRRALKEILGASEQSLFIRGIRSWVGFKQIGIKYNREERTSGAPKYTLKKLFLLAYNGLFGFSKFPVKFIFILGLVVFLISTIYTFFLLFKFLFFGGIPEGFTSLILAIIGFSSVQLIALGLIGEYVLRIYDESRGRPLFIVKKKIF